MALQEKGKRLWTAPEGGACVWESPPIPQQNEFGKIILNSGLLFLTVAENQSYLIQSDDNVETDIA